MQLLIEVRKLVLSRLYCSTIFRLLFFFKLLEGMCIIWFEIPQFFFCPILLLEPCYICHKKNWSWVHCCEMDILIFYFLSHCTSLEKPYVFKLILIFLAVVEFVSYHFILEATKKVRD